MLELGLEEKTLDFEGQGWGEEAFGEMRIAYVSAWRSEIK